jgi:RNA polymerase sigma factor (sigma-70 family)
MPTSSNEHRLEDLLRELTPQVLGAVVRWSGDFAAAEDAVQEALLAAALTWPKDGTPDNPKAWLIQTASRRLIDEVRQVQARRRREERAALRDLPPEDVEERDTLQLLFLCSHPALTPASAIALTLRAVGGLTTAEIATAYLVPEATMAQRISRAKQKIKGAAFELDASEERLRNVLHVLYLMFNEGYTTSSGPELQRSDLSGEAIPADPHSARTAAGQRSGDRSARADAPERRPPSRTHRQRRRAYSTRGAGPHALEPGLHHGRRGTRGRSVRYAAPR